MRVLTAVVFLSITATASAQSPKEIIERAIRAHGGADALVKTKAMTQKASGRVNFQGIDVDATREAKWALPERVAWTVDLSAPQKKMKVQLVMNGLSGWQSIDG